jgi:iron complex transport system substrate-binding protein
MLVDASPRPFRALVTLASLVLVVAACSGGAATASPPTASAPPSVAPSAAPSVAASPSAAAFPISLTDDEGTAVEIAAQPERIVSLTPATTEILFAIGAGERVVATTDFDDYPPEAVALPDVASFTAVDVEKIVGLEADLVLAGGNNFNDPAAIAQLRSLGTPVVVTYAADIEGVLRDIELVGAAVGEADAARDLAVSMQARFDQIGAATAGLERPRVFYELDATTEIYTAADDSFVEQMIELAGGDPITTGSPTSFSISLERLIDADPQLILLGDAAYGVTPEIVAARPGWAVMTAVRDGRITAVDDIVITRPGPRLVEGLRQLAAAIHPDVALPSAAPASAGPQP